MDISIYIIIQYLYYFIVSCIWLFVTPWTITCQAPLSMEFFRPEYWSGLHSPLQGIFLIQWSNQYLLHCRQILYHLSPTYATDWPNYLDVYWTSFLCGSIVAWWRTWALALEGPGCSSSFYVPQRNGGTTRSSFPESLWGLNKIILWKPPSTVPTRL